MNYFRPDYAPESSSDESDEEFIVKRTKQKAELKEEEELEEEEINDPRLRRLQVIHHMGLVTRKPVFGVSNKVSFKPVSSATETS